MSCDPEVTNESARCWEEISSYVTIFLVQRKPFFAGEGHDEKPQQRNRSIYSSKLMLANISQKCMLWKLKKNAGATVAQDSQSFSNV